MAEEQALHISSRAMGLIGADNVNSFDDGTNESQVAALFYETTLRSCLTEHRWSFAVMQGQGSLLLAAPNDRFSKQYELPAPILSIDRINPDHIDYELFANRKILTDYDGELWVEGVYRVDETAMPDYFIEYFEYRLASKFAFPVASDRGLASTMGEFANAFQKKAKSADSKQRKGVGFKKFSLIQARG